MSRALSRRRLLAHASAYMTAAALPWRTPHAAAAAAVAASTGLDLLSLSASEAVAAMVRGDMNSERYAEALLARCREGARLNAFIAQEPQQVLEAARHCDLRRRRGEALGPLHGLPIPVKDSVNTRDLPTTAGTEALRHFRPRADAPIVQRLKSAGSILLGKASLHELSYGYTCSNPIVGATRNPYDTRRIPGGSSGGTAAAVAYRMAPLGVGEDTEGSIRIPASLSGTAGFRPTTGRYPTTGAVPIAATFDQLGPLARSVQDLLLFDTVVSGDSTPVQRRALNGVRLGVVRPYFFTALDPETERITDAALKTLERAGVELVEGSLPDLPRLLAGSCDPIQYHDVRASLTDYLSRYETGVTFDELLAKASPQVRSYIAMALPGGQYFVSDAQYRNAVDVQLPAFRKMFQEYFARTGVSAIVFPATVMPAPIRGPEEMQVQLHGRSIALDEALARNIAPGSGAGLPCLVLPAGLTSQGLPVGLEFDGPAGADRALLELGLALEQALGRLPPPGVPA